MFYGNNDIARASIPVETCRVGTWELREGETSELGEGHGSEYGVGYESRWGTFEGKLRFWARYGRLCCLFWGNDFGVMGVLTQFLHLKSPVCVPWSRSLLLLAKPVVLYQSLHNPLSDPLDTWRMWSQEMFHYVSKNVHNHKTKQPMKYLEPYPCTPTIKKETFSDSNPVFW